MSIRENQFCLCFDGRIVSSCLYCLWKDNTVMINCQTISQHFVLQQEKFIFGFLLLKSARIRPKAMSRLGRTMCQWHVIATVTANEVLISLPGRVAQSVGQLTCWSEVLGSIPGLATYFRVSFRWFMRGSCQLLAKVTGESMCTKYWLTALEV